MTYCVKAPFGENLELVLENGQIARQAHGAVKAAIGGTVVLAAVVRSDAPLAGGDFLPLTVDYRERHYAAGRIPGNFFRRESRPGTPETLTARLIDRTLRPMFPKGFRHEVQVYLTVLSMDQKNPADVAGLIAASAALAISDIPFNGPVAAMRVGMCEGEFVLNPTFEQLEAADLDLVVGGTRSAISMVESGSNYLSDEKIVEALDLGHKSLILVIESIDELVKLCGKEKMEFVPPAPNTEVVNAVAELAAKAFPAIDAIAEKKAREEAVNAAREEIVAALLERFSPAEGEALDGEIRSAFDAAYKKNVRLQIVNEGVRADGRKLDEIRPITIDMQYLPMAHGSAVFTRGQTQSLGVVTLGTAADQQKIDNLLGFSSERFMMHYNFPSYSVGEVRRIMGPGRRELGHGALSQRALEPILPSHDDFPYTIRVVSEILESNGSSSMASVCSGCLALMDAGVPIKAPVAGIAMGLIKEADKVAILTDIMGMEDHLGDMDFKVAGTRDGINSLQMDIKIDGIDFSIIKKALAQALEARCRILAIMAEAMPASRPELSPHAPRIEVVQIDPQRIGDLIGPSGKNIRGIVEATNAKIDVEEDGRVFIATSDGEAMAAAKRMVLDLTADVELDKIYSGKVVRITDFGAFVEILPKKDGLVHISELDNRRVASVGDVCREGDMIKVKVIGIDDQGKVRLSRKQALAETEGATDGASFSPTLSEAGSEPEPRDEGNRGGRGSDRDRGRDRGARDRGGRDRGGRDRGGRDRGGRD